MLKLDEKNQRSKEDDGFIENRGAHYGKAFFGQGCKRMLHCLKLAWIFELRLNGERVGDEYFLPLHSIYHAMNFRKMTYPIKDKLTYRAYYSTYDLLPYLK